MSSTLSLILSPVPTTIVALANAAVSHYYNIPLYKMGLLYTGTVLGIGLFASIVGGLIGYKWSKEDPSNGIVGAIMFVAPTGIAFYKIAIFWSVLFSLNNFLLFKNFIS